uniref:Uncharacterized protein n=1 Tax=Aegilops tauschii subsp. strangulata TaxID=200361 RepID=A0A453S2S0_AEGTS
ARPDESWARNTSPGDDASTSHAPHPEGASPDLLRNTPSNIARLEDAIENCAARRKYLARTKSPSDGEDVRWYFCKLPLGDRGALFFSSADGDSWERRLFQVQHEGLFGVGG